VHDRRWLLPAALFSLVLMTVGTVIAANDELPIPTLPAPAVAVDQAYVSPPRPDGETFEQRALARERAAKAAAAARHAKLVAARRKARHVAAVHRARRVAALRKTRHVSKVRVHRLTHSIHRVRVRARVCNRHRRHTVCHAHRAHQMRPARHALRHARHALRHARHALARQRAHRRTARAHHAAVQRRHRQAAIRRARRIAAQRANQRATFQLPRRTKPGHVVRGHYIRHLTGHPRDERIMRRLGAADGRRNPRGMGHLVLLDIGGQTRHGVRLSIIARFVSYRALVRAMNAYVAGYHSRQRPNAPVTISLGTNNDLYTSAHAGWLWATRVVNPVQAAAKRYPDITIAGADDIEPGFSASPRATRRWLHGYLRHTNAPFVFNGSADGCSWTRPLSHCNRGWTARTLARLAGGAAPKRILALPQIYNREMAGQWAQISRTAARLHHKELNIVGPLTEQRACGRNPACPSMPSHSAWWLLHHKLHLVGLRPRSLPVQVDLDVH